MGQAIAVTDHELLEGQLRVEADVGGGSVPPRWYYVRPAGPIQRRAARDDLDGDRVREHLGGALLEQAQEAVGDPVADLDGRVDDQCGIGELANLKRLEPDPVGRRRHLASESHLDA